MKVALATCRELPHLDSDEEYLVAALKKRGVDVIHPAWDAGDEPFLSADLTVIRSTWDYTEKVDDFVAWAARIPRIMNPPSVVRWNVHKRYLLELKQQGIGIVPTALIPKGAACDLKTMLESYRWTKGAVVKPAVSAGSRDTVRVHDLEVGAAQELLTRMLPARDMLVQPFVPGVEQGELSLIYVDGMFTHAVNKKPKNTDFRSQPEFGSRVERASVSDEWKSAADSIVRTVGGMLLYARVDLVAGAKGEPLLMELELVEPSLYLKHSDDAADTLAEAITRRGKSPRATS